MSGIAMSRIAMVRMVLMTFVCLFANCAAAKESPPAANCVDIKQPWTCFGALELKVPVDGQQSTARMIRFSNGDLLFEIQNADGLQRALVVLPSGSEFFYGLKSRLNLEAGMNPFDAIDQGFGAVLTLLQKAFPQGPASVGQQPQQVSVPLGSDKTAQVAVQRVDAKTVSYHMSVIGDKKFDGIVNEEVRTPLPNSFSLQGWMSQKADIKTLGAARSLKPPPAAKR